MQRKTFTTAILCLLLSSAFAQFLKTEGTAIINDSGDTILLRAMGLGGWMLQEGYMLQTAEFANPQHEIKEKITDLIGEDATEEFYDAWLNNHVTKADIDSMAAWGFNAIRLPMHYNLYTVPIQEETSSNTQTWLDRGFEMTDELIEWCKANEMYVILDLHAAPGGQGYDAGISDYDEDLPSLWENFNNQTKTVELWKRIADRYKDEPWVAAYDLINEPNWNLPGGTALRNLYVRITDAIREVDQKHIIMIEGNWFANDFTGLTPPWDDNMVYSPHKYWSFNEQSDIDYATRLLAFNVPIFFGESGENSNAWFRDAIKLFEENGIGWAWWPEKKIESIAGLMSIIKTPEYERLLQYWKDEAPRPNASFARAALMEITENLKIQNCRIQKDVIDAMIRQPHSDETLPFKKHSLPGKIHAVDYDLGTAGFAYDDVDVATYHVSNNNYTAWNQGWAYRNDGVDIEPTEDPENTVGYNVGWLEKGDWMQYEINVDEPGVYDINVRVASEALTGQFHFEVDGAPITPLTPTNRTGGWQTWNNRTISDVVFTGDDKKLRFVADNSGTNLSSFEFIRTGDISDVQPKFVSAFTLDEQTIQLNLSKKIKSPQSPFFLDRLFLIYVNDIQVGVTEATLNSDNERVLTFKIDQTLTHTDQIQITYNANAISGQDDTLLEVFLEKPVQNRLPQKLQIPGRIQAEAFSNQLGIVLEVTTDNGGGQNIGYLAPGDYCEYEVNVRNGGVYDVIYRTASLNNGGSLRLQLKDTAGIYRDLHAASFSPTGGWQDWANSRAFQANLPKGEHTIRLLMTGSEFNVNWFQFDLVSKVEEVTADSPISIFPNPTSDMLFIESKEDLKISEVSIFDAVGKLTFVKQWNQAGGQINISHLPKGTYNLKVTLQNGEIFSQQVVRL